ncbi:hypothetical protein HGRIS_011506 [Hohenbuehelia grisea]|uniref:Tail specific protease domain-containing protein n=1 Tax=Hohenbuehelia grisea TaxID=104357 RepID=A0ABR3JW47_9AGAR
MLSVAWLLVSLLSLSLPKTSASSEVGLEARAADPCVAIAGQKWVAPADVRNCFKSFKVDQAIKTNILDVVNKTLAFHTSVNYQIQAPPPFQNDVHEDLLKDIARIRTTNYASDYDLHVDLSRTLKRLNDGHCVWINRCFDSSFVNFLPIPLVLLTEADGKTQNVHIAPEAFTVATAEFPDQIDVWQNSLKGSLKGNLQSLSGAKVLLINGLPPNFAVDANAKITGSFQGLGTRQNTFFSSYQRATTGWSYIMGNFAQQSLPLDDDVTLLLQRVNHTLPEVVKLPYRSRIGAAIAPFTDGPSFRANNCVAVPGTNGVDINAASLARVAPAEVPLIQAQQQPPVPIEVQRKHLVNVFMDGSPLSDVVLPPGLTPPSPVNGSLNAAQFYLLADGKTGVLALGSFSDNSFEDLFNALLNGLLNLKSLGATQLVVDVTNNGGGFICIAHYLHRLIIGPKDTTVPQAGLDTKARAGPLAQLIVKEIVENNADPREQLLYNPANWRNASGEFFAPTDDWLQPPVQLTINGHRDAFSQRLGQECQPESFVTPPPDTALFAPNKVVIVSNGRCASSCSLFSITMSKEEGVKTVVVGGRQGVQQQYCGTVGGQSTDFSTIDTEIKSTGLKNNSLAPPDLYVAGFYHSDPASFYFLLSKSPPLKAFTFDFSRPLPSSFSALSPFRRV